MTSERLEQWMDAYVEAWDSNDPEAIAALFTEDAVYDPQTSDGPWHGKEEIIEGWRDAADAPGSWEFEWQPLVETEDLAIITGRTRYLDPPTVYRNLWVIRFAPESPRQPSSVCPSRPTPKCAVSTTR